MELHDSVIPTPALTKLCLYPLMVVTQVIAFV